MLLRFFLHLADGHKTGAASNTRQKHTMKQSTYFALQERSYTTRYTHVLQGATYEKCDLQKRAYEKTSYAQQPSDFSYAGQESSLGSRALLS